MSADRRGSRRRPYVESPVIMSTVRLIVPFVLTFGLFVTLHGASSPGGGFQGGVLIASVIVMLSFAYGIDLTWEWLDKRALVGLTAGGVGLFGAVALGTLLFDGGFFQLGVYPIEDGSKYGIELVEVAIAMIVTGVVTTMFFVLARGAMQSSEATETPGVEDQSAEPDASTDGGVARGDPNGDADPPIDDRAPGGERA